MEGEGGERTGKRRNRHKREREEMNGDPGVPEREMRAAHECWFVCVSVYKT